MATEPLPQFYQRQDVSNVDLNQIFAYDDAAWRAHNRALHGCGVVCGLAVELSADGQSATVSPGYALSPQGDEILVTAPAQVALDCVERVDDCADPDGKKPQSEFLPAYLILRPATAPGQERLLEVAPCQPRECAPTRVCPGFEVVCTTEPPAACPPRFDFSGCEAQTLIRRLLEMGDLNDSGLFGCPSPGDETAIVLARVNFRRENRRVVADLSYEERAYLPSIQFLFDLAQIVGAQAAKSQIVPASITGLDQPPTRRLRLNRGVEVEQLAVHGFGLNGATSVRASDRAVAIPPLRWDSSERLFIDVVVPYRTAQTVVSLLVTFTTGPTLDSSALPDPVVIELFDNDVDAIPRIVNLPQLIRVPLVRRLRDVGYETAQSVAAEEPETLRAKFNTPFGFPQLTREAAVALVASTRVWLRDGAPPTRGRIP